MKQIVQDIKTGKTLLQDVPSPCLKQGYVLIQTRKSLVSLGTERMLVEFGKAGLIAKAKQQPEKVKQVIDKISTDGLLPTFDSIKNKLNKPIPMGYSNVGIVIGVGSGTSEFSIGDRVVSNGPHAEIVNVPQNLVAKIPDNVPDSAAVFTVLGAIALQGIRLVNPTFGETVVVIGLGLIGLITVQILLKNGCQVIGFDYDEVKVNLARTFGANAIKLTKNSDPVRYVLPLTDNFGSDAVIVTATTKDDSVISNAAKMSRKRGRIVLVGVVGLKLNRSDFYEKELTFQVSCSYGPGRYDEEYEQNGHDYPIGFVRWTENRNFKAILNALASGQLNTEALISQEVSLDDYHQIYDRISKSKSIASLIDYNLNSNLNNTIEIYSSKRAQDPQTAIIGVIGAGNFTSGVVLPILHRIKVKIRYIASESGLSASLLAKRYKIDKVTTDYKVILEDESVSAIIITTQHNSHAELARDCLLAGKSVFVEKPLALDKEQLDSLIDAYKKSPSSLTVGFNRRFSKHSIFAKNLIKDSKNIQIIMTVNAGQIPNDSWLHDPLVGGGRLIGEACHFLDLGIFLAGSLISSVCATSLGNDFDIRTDNASILVKYRNGSTSVINYISTGSKSFPKERIDIFDNGTVITIDNFKRTISYGKSGNRKLRGIQDKGHNNQFSLLHNVIKLGGESLIPFDQLINSTRATFAIVDSLREKRWVDVS